MMQVWSWVGYGGGVQCWGWGEVEGPEFGLGPVLGLCEGKRRVQGWGWVKYGGGSRVASC